MSVSKLFENTWSYDRNADDFNAKVGRILTSGMDYGTLRTASGGGGAAGTGAGYAGVAGLGGGSGGSVGKFASGHGSQSNGRVLLSNNDDKAATVRSTGSAGSSGQRFALVDENGHVVRNAPEKQTLSSQQAGTSPSRRSAITKMTSTERSMHLWRRLSPGCVESTTKTPESTMHDHFQYDKNLNSVIDPLNETYHLKKTEFSEYTEVKLRVMHHIKNSAS